MNKKILIFTITLFIGLQSFSQKKTKGISFSLKISTADQIEKPKLVIGIVVDQMRYDYIYRFWNYFGEDGFKRLVNEGHFFRNAQFGYTPTFTGPGHASIFTGTTPSVHGIIANNWYDKQSHAMVYCAGDGSRETICNCEKNHTDVISTDGQMSPHQMLTTTIGDEMQLFNPESKVIGISLKDRGAILSAGHAADAAYWMDSKGEWITSSYYMDELPDWLKEFQDANPSSNYLNGEWKVEGEFSHNLDSLFITSGASGIKSTPFGNTILKDLAMEILKNEKLGEENSTDFLSVSFSSTDYIGHQYGPHAWEVIDTYIRLDKDIAELLKLLNKTVGFENAVVFLTADHGVVSEPSELLKLNIPAGYFESQPMKDSLKVKLNKVLGEEEWIKNISNNQVFLNRQLISDNNLELEKVQQICADFLLKYEWVKNTYTATQLHENEYSNSFHSLIQKGYNQKRSGDVIYTLQTGWISKYWGNGGTTHGSSYSYDTHVPLVFWGGNIPQGQTDRKVNIRDIAPTISTILGISFPNGCTGNPLVEVTQ